MVFRLGKKEKKKEKVLLISPFWAVGLLMIAGPKFMLELVHMSYLKKRRNY